MKSNHTLQVFLRLLGLGKSYIFWYILLCLITSSLAFINVAIAEMFKRLANAAVDKDIDLLVQTAGLAIGILIINGAGPIVSKALSGILEYRSTLFLQSKLLHKILMLRIADIEKYHSADLINRISESVHAAQNAVNVKSQEVLGNVVQIVLVLTYLTFINIWLTIGALLIAVLLPVLMNFLSKPMRVLYTNRQNAIVEKESFVQEVIQGGEVIRSYSLLDRMKDIFKQKYDSIYQSHFKLLRYEVLIFRTHTFVWMLGILYVFGYGGYLVSTNHINVGEVVAFAIAFERFAFPLSGLAGIWSQFQNSIAHGSRIFELLDHQEERRSKSKLGSGRINKIQFKDVSFAYHENQKTLKNVSLLLQAGTPTALVGPSGSGKSTVASLILGFYEPDSGDILINNDNINHLDIAELRRRIAYIPQEPFLFAGSIYANIAAGKEGTSMDEVIKAAKAAQIHDYIVNTKNQYDTLIGEGGLQLSGGERQRIVIARTLLANSEVIILDEPTSSLDTENEKLIVEEFKKYFPNRIILIISHRLSTIREVEHVVFMEHGKIIEQGNYQELIQRKGSYYNMFISREGEVAG